MKIKHLPQSGYIAIVSSLLLTAIILTVTFTAASNVFFSRAGTTTLKDKRGAKFLAESCLEVALLNLADDRGYSGNETVAVNNLNCRIGSITLVGSNRVIQASASTTVSFANLKLTVASSSLQKISLEEVQQF